MTTDFRSLCAELADNLHRYQCWYIEDNGYSLQQLEDLLRRADAALSKPGPEGPPQPIAVSERLPGPEDCDAKGRCWWWEPDETDEDSGWWILVRIRGNTGMYTHWLPAHALPVPPS